ncbi:MAG: hypothetical protein ALECFALPRED_007413 [Alectoria fallacina]|uniref:Uncharacterized protein n=1 Tax=Alectoria fallacina TaxID=1903189 RepID=A0A8H3IFC5_9LECA|nr:MAG: hypothetical protein ALECFALPRED_007413 [Alectoria fallacina]
MVSKRKSVTFRENVSMVTPKPFDGFTSPAPITAVPTSTSQSLELDPMYLTWLRSATKAQYPFIVNGTFAKHIYHQNFDLHLNVKHPGNVQFAQERGAAVTVLAETYGSLGWGSLYKEVTEEAWVKNYREIYRFDGSDEQLLEKIAEAYHEIKRTIAEDKAKVPFTQDGSTYSSIYSSPSKPKWEAFTQGGGALSTLDLDPGGVCLTLDHAANAPFDEEESVPFSRNGRGGNGDERVFDTGAVAKDFGTAMANAGTERRMFWAGPRQSMA